MTIPAQVYQLVERFDQNLTAYKQGHYNETQVRMQYIDPLFKALGWDIRNEKGLNEVVPEEAIKVGRATKFPDYSFRTGPHDQDRKFFLEAKKPSVDIKRDTHPAYQLRRYAWSAKLPLSILTDFEEFAVFDCRIKPIKTDKADTARMMYVTFDEYADKWEDIYSLFSREAIYAGALEKYVEVHKAKRGTVEVDDAFLQEIERWRDMLARNFALRNTLTQRELNYAVQLTIDRIIFLRIAEDRGIEPYEQLKDLLKVDNIYANLLRLFERADDRYNAGLFHFKAEKGRENPDTLTGHLALDNNVLKDIFKNLYYPDSPYEFSVLPADILGQVYEQFLGQVILLTPKGRAKVEAKPEVKKAGGVYYTPTYIVAYIVKQTIGKLVEGKKPGDIGDKNPLRVLDPACGSGSFLLGAYQFLLDWYLGWYSSNNPERWAKGRNPHLYKVGESDWRLTIDERKRILLTHIYGVDIDTQAVEVTKLSLLLKVLEDEKSVTQQLALFQERVLPDLENNIKCGNSLIGPDFYASNPTQMSMFDEDEFYRINAFDWQGEFAGIMGDGGFDAVIGNPPYGAVFSSDMNSYLKECYSTFIGRGESYLLFTEQALKLLRTEAWFGFIIPDTYLNLGFTEVLRTYLLRESVLQEIVLLPSNIFEGTTVDTTLLITKKSQPAISDYHQTLVQVKTFNKKSVISSIKQPHREFQIRTDFWFEQNAFNVEADESEIVLIEKIEDKKVKVSQIAEMFSGIKVYEVGKGTPPQTPKIRATKPFTSNTQENEAWRPIYNGKDIDRYKLLWEENNWIHYGPWVAAPRNPENFEGEKILIRKIVGQTLIATYIPETSYCNTLLFVLKIKDIRYSYHYLLGILNSRLIGWYFRKKFQISSDDTFPQIMIRDIIQFPIRTINFDNPTDKARHDKMVSLVEQMLTLHKQLNEAKVPQQKTMFKRQIEATDRQIDNLVYELYGLTDEEIRIVEG